MGKVIVKAPIDYVSGHLRYCHYELEIDEDEWNKLSDDEKHDELIDNGEIIVDDYEMEDYGSIEMNNLIIKPAPEETVTISKSEYQILNFESAQLNALENAGVDNWEYYSEVDWPNEEDYFDN